MKMKDMLRAAKELGKVEVEAPEGLWGKIKAGLEVWKVIEEVPSYEISNMGTVRRLVDGKSGSKAGQVIKPWDNNRGYLQVSLFKCGRNKSYKVHRLVAKAFVPNPMNLPEVNHTGEKTDNRATMLEWRSKAGHKLDQALRHQRGSGVRFYRFSKKWVATYSFEGKLKHIGYFLTKKEATIARDAAVKELPYIL